MFSLNRKILSLFRDIAETDGVMCIYGAQHNYIVTYTSNRQFITYLMILMNFIYIANAVVAVFSS